MGSPAALYQARPSLQRLTWLLTGYKRTILSFNDTGLVYGRYKIEELFSRMRHCHFRKSLKNGIPSSLRFRAGTTTWSWIQEISTPIYTMKTIDIFDSLQELLSLQGMVKEVRELIITTPTIFHLLFRIQTLIWRLFCSQVFMS